MTDTWSRRRALRAIGATTALTVAGCGERSSPDAPTDATTATADTPTDSPTAAPTDEADRPTATERSPRSLDVDGTWTQFGADAGHNGVTDAAGVPESGEAYWHLRRVRSGPPALADGRLFHYAKLGEDGDDRPTVTRTVTETRLDHPVYGDPTLVARDASDSRIEWAQSLPNSSSGWPAVVDRRVIACVKGEIAAFDAVDGTQRWSRDVGEHGPGNPTVVDDVVVVPIQGVVDGSGEYVRRPSIRAYALDDGTEHWSVEPPKRAC